MRFPDALAENGTSSNRASVDGMGSHGSMGNLLVRCVKILVHGPSPIAAVQSVVYGPFAWASSKKVLWALRDHEKP